MKLFFQLIFFIVALLLTFGWLIIVGTLISDLTPQGLLGIPPISRYTEEEFGMVIAGLIIPSTIALVIYFLLWKTNFFSRNK